MKKFIFIAVCLIFVIGTGAAFAADTVPTNIQQPGTQPGDVSNLESPDKCDNCHGGYNTATEPAFNWRGSMMANAGRDPIFWATLAVAEQDFDGAGDLCIRCHSTAGWLAGRSTPTDGSGLAAGDSDGVECDFCHMMTNPDNSEHLGVMFDPFIANQQDLPGPLQPGDAEGYYGSGIASLWGGSDKLGPYVDAEARHQFMKSNFHRSVDFCGTCHDVSNAAVGNLAHNNGAQATADPVIADGNPGLTSPVDTKAAFKNPPYKYGIVERTFSEYKSGMISQTLVDDYPTLPADLQGGALQAIYNDATQGGTVSANYEDGDPRYYSCQSCHMRPVFGQGCNKNPPFRSDLPLHDMTGGNYWMPEAIKYLDGQGKLRLGGGLTSVQTAALDAAALRAKEQLELAASLSIQGNTLKIVNHTGHKLISGYPEGRRMWLNIKWYDNAGVLVREDGAYGPITAIIDDTPTQVDTILDLHDPNTKIYEAHYAMTQTWAGQLISLGWDPQLALSYDRNTGTVDCTLQQLADGLCSTAHPDYAETFHFVLNNKVAKDNRIPPYGMDYEEARKRNALPVPATQYNGGPGKTYDYFDTFALNAPQGAASATIDLVYQPTSWEYIQFLHLANNGQNAFLANEGVYMLEAWLNNGMAAPHLMASVTWGTPPGECNAPTPTLLTATPGDQQVTTTWQEIPGDPAVLGYGLFYDQAGKAQLITQLLDPAANNYMDTGLTNGQEYCYKVTSLYDCDGDGTYDPALGDVESGFSNIHCAIPNNQGQLRTGVDTMETGKYVKQGKGKNATIVFEPATTFAAGEGVVIRAHVIDKATGLPLENATVDISITGPETPGPLSAVSDANGIAEATWQTQAPNKKGVGGTTPGIYTATTTNVTAAGYTWDGVMTNSTLTIQ
jgi:hypothetical protein